MWNTTMLAIILGCTAVLYNLFILHSSVQFRRSVMSDSLRPHGLQYSRPPGLSPTPRVYSNSCSLSRWCCNLISKTHWKSPHFCQTPPQSLATIILFSASISLTILDTSYNKWNFSIFVFLWLAYFIGHSVL